MMKIKSIKYKELIIISNLGAIEYIQFVKTDTIRKQGVD